MRELAHWESDGCFFGDQAIQARRPAGAGECVGAIVLVGRWLNATKRGGQGPAKPFRIAGNLYYVGASDAAAFLITGPEGHIVLDGGYPTTTPMIMASIATLGFSIKDVKVLLNSEPHPDHAGGLGVLQQASGARIWASEASAYSLASGGDDPRRVTARFDRTYPDRSGRFTGPCSATTSSKTENTIRLGPLALVAHITGGHTRGCTSWSFSVRDGERLLNVVSACDLGILELSLSTRSRLRTWSAASACCAVCRSTSGSPATHDGGVEYIKFVASTTAANPTDPFIDPDGYRAYIDTAEKEFRNSRMH